jgi:CheY-like chemotaxis protein
MAHAATARPVVLVVEDEFLIRMHAVEIIQDAGFDVVEAADANEAIAILESRRDIRVVFTDIRMPGSMDGLKLAHAVRDRWPPVHIIATSGYHAITATDLPAGSLLLLKPYSERKIVDALHAFTGAPR